MPIIENTATLPIHVTIPRDRAHGLCGAFALSHCYPPKAIEIGRARAKGEPGEGTIIELSDVELEAGWLTIVKRHPESPKLVDICRGCLEHVGKLRDQERRRGADGRVKRETRSAGDDARSAAAKRREAKKLETWIEETAYAYGDE